MKKIISIVLILLLTLELAGCEAVVRKFTRKKKREPLRPRFYQEGMSDTRPHLELYMMHYMYWKTWHEDLIVHGGSNAKKDRMACAEIMSNLADMRNNLVEEKAKELDEYMADVKKITDEIKDSGSSVTRLGYLRNRLGTLKARIMRNFYYKKVREYIKPD